ncbi:MAG: lipopolysaccharide assembly LapA domain-containing protein [Calditrichaceae bacterium]
MRVISIFFWIIFGAIILWFFTLNLGSRVDIYLFNSLYEQVPVVTVIFISLFVGVVLGALLLSTQLLKAKGQVSGIRKENKRLVKELEGLRNLSIDEIPDTDTRIGPDKDN